MLEIDFNSDLGEGFGLYRVGDDEAVLAQITSANIACGFHAGDPAIMRRTVAAAVRNGVAVGAHPGFADLQGFGRRKVALSADQAYECVLYQIGALSAFAAAEGTLLHHVKPHGALYNQAAADPVLANAICEAVRDFDPSLYLYGLANSALTAAAEALGLAVRHEVFADRTYQPDGSLTPRGQAGAMITNVDQALVQVRSMLHHGHVLAVDGTPVPVRPDTLCIHGDQPGAADFARAIRQALLQDGVDVRAAQLA
ncbi:LamB/YcsF family protein [Pseudomonas sp. S75]|uniref:LamB/YcsF family protein n=1 Tax=unclassified Pseudomonas TaxID=196821 RepID=UPI001907171E|nr:MULTISPECIES: 5-oxoprolinase subunit PxpA [unclassified Pseudomonas]MBJ9978103.1 LamB/YcsF family protein [Pseudomonas sp. S30]MBK0155934.1 LamB/YcsF family protein [Pseudomonas sp. S75]